VLAVHELMLETTDYVRDGQGPAFIEGQTYRLRGHSIADPADYRPEEEVQYWQGRDPILRFHNWLTEKELASGEQLEEIDAAVEQEIAMAVEFAESSPFPAPEELYANVYTP
jgi:pyruvate dehydrogenase E1 component alpha subunit